MTGSSTFSLAPSVKAPRPRSRKGADNAFETSLTVTPLYRRSSAFSSRSRVRAR